MSTRIEKGGPKFKPILKSKARSSETSTLDGRAARLSAVGAVHVNMQDPTSTEFLSRQDADYNLLLDSGNTSSRPGAVSSPSKSAGIPIMISKPRAPSTTIHTPQKAPTGLVTVQGSTSIIASTSNYDANSDDRQETVTSQHGRVSQKQPRQSLVETADDDPGPKHPKRATRRTGTAVETATGVEPVTSFPAKGKLKRQIQMYPKDKQSKQVRPSKRQRSESSFGDSSEQVDGGAAAKKKRSKRDVAEAAESYAEPIDPTQITMRAICDDLGAGRKSSRWESSQTLYSEARKRAKEERAQRILEIEQQEMETGRSSKRGLLFKPPLPKQALSGDDEHGENQRDEFLYDEALKTSHYAPQVRIGANGEIVVDVDSLQVDRSADPDLIEEYSHIEENDHSKFTNSSSWSKRRLVRWGKEDTALFYDALRQFGQNFDLIARVLPGKTYRMCKNKFKAEDKKNPSLIDEALKNAVAVDLNTLSRLTGKDFTGPTPIIVPRLTLSLGGSDDLTASQQPENNTTGLENTETQDQQ